MKIICPMHDDTEPSMHVYRNEDKNIGYCFVCSARIDLKEYRLETKSPIKVVKSTPIDIAARMDSIFKLPVRKIRGLNLHVDDRGYYIVWPDNKFYKLRLMGNSRTRYIAPSGVKQPLFIYPSTQKRLLIVEGELNAMSIHSIVNDRYTVCSPGPATDFMRHINSYLKYDVITIISDYDAPGVVFGSQLKEALLKLKKHVILICIKQDFNQVLQEEGVEGLRRFFKREIA